MMEVFSLLIISAALVEAILETIMLTVQAFQKKDINTVIAKISALLVGILFSFNYNLDLPKLVGLQNHFAWFGVLITGILLSRGASFLHDLVKLIENNKNLTKR